MNTDRLALHGGDPSAIEVTAALKQGDERLPADEPRIAICVIVDEKGGGRTPLHLFAHWPGHSPNASAIVKILVARDADLDWLAPWTAQIPLNIAEKAGHGEVVAWLIEGYEADSEGGAEVQDDRRYDQSPARRGDLAETRPLGRWGMP